MTDRPPAAGFDEDVEQQIKRGSLAQSRDFQRLDRGGAGGALKRGVSKPPPPPSESMSAITMVPPSCLQLLAEASPLAWLDEWQGGGLAVLVWVARYSPRSFWVSALSALALIPLLSLLGLC